MSTLPIVRAVALGLVWLATPVPHTTSGAEGVASGSGELRAWTGRDGRVFRATLESRRGSQVQLRLADGSLLTLWVQHLSQEDQAFLEASDGDGAIPPRVPPEKRIWPQIVEVDTRSVEVHEAPAVDGFYVYTSRSFEFRSQEKLAKGVMREVARTFEATRTTIEALPWGVTPRPPHNAARFEARLYRSHDDYVEAGAPPQSGGVYSRSDGFFRAPFDSLGLRERGKTWFMERDYSNAVIIHELTHQMMDELLPFLPTWVIEGTAEYVEMLPYNAGRFQAGQHRRGIREQVEIWDSRGLDAGDVPGFTNLMRMPREQWNSISFGQTPREQAALYYGSLLLVYYFCHLDAEKAAFLEYLDTAADDARAWREFFAHPEVQRSGDGFKHPASLDPPENAMSEEAALGRVDMLLRGRDEKTLLEDLRGAYKKIGIDI